MKNKFQSKAVPRGTRTIWRYLSALFILFTFAVGQMWGAESATNDPATVEYGTGSAKKTFLDVSNTVSNTTIKTGSVACVTYGLMELHKNWKPDFCTGPTNTSSSSYNYSNAADFGFMAGSSAGTGTAANKSATSGYGAIKYTSSAEGVFYVTGITGIAVMGKDNNTSSEKRLYIKVEEYAADGTCTAVGTGDGITKSSYSTSLHITTFDAGTLSGTKYYKVTLTSGNTSNCETSQIRFTKYIAPSCDDSNASIIENTAVYVDDELDLEFSSDNVNSVSYSIKKNNETTTDASVTDGVFKATVAGTYVVTATQAKDASNHCAVEVSVTITVNPKTPVTSATIEGATSGFIGNAISYTATAAYATSYEWYVNDTKQSETSAEFEYTPAAKGNYNIYCKATNAHTTTPVQSNTIALSVTKVCGVLINFDNFQANTNSTPAAVTLSSPAKGVIGGTGHQKTRNGAENGGYRFSANDMYLGLTLASGTFKAGDKLKINVITEGTKVVSLYSSLTGDMLQQETYTGTGEKEFTLNNKFDGATSVYMYRKTDASEGNGTFSSISVSRPCAESDDATLAFLKIAGEDVTPSENVYSYEVSSTETATKVAVTYALNNGFATATPASGFEINIPTAGNPANTQTLTVTAEDGTHNNTYTISVSRASGLSDDATLSALAVTGYTLSPTFAAATENYTITKAYGTADPTADKVVAETNHASANAEAVLDSENHKLVVTVTAEDNSTQKVYNITINEAEAPKNLSRVLFSNGFDAFIDNTNHTVKAYYLAGTSAPTATTITAGAGTAGEYAEGKITVTGDDASSVDYTVTLEAVTPNTTTVAAEAAAGEFAGNEGWVKNGLFIYGTPAGYDSTNKRYTNRRLKRGTDAEDDQRVIAGWVRSYFFVGNASKFIMTISGNKNLDYAIDGGTPVENVNVETLEIALTKGNHMIEIVSHQTNGDCYMSAPKLVELPPTYAVTYSAGEGSVKSGESLPTQDAVEAGAVITLASADVLEKSGSVFDGWLCSVNSTKYNAGAEYTMTAAATTFTAQWEDNSKVAMIVETSVKYNDLAAAIEAAEPGQTVQLIQDINQEEAILIAKNLTLDLNNKTLTVTNPSDSYSNRAIKVTDGTIVIENGTVDALSNETHNGGCWGSLRQEGGHLTCNNVTFKNYRSGGLGLKPVGGTLILNECTVLSEIGGGLELGNATVEVNNCTFTQTGTDANKIYGACFGMGKMGTLTINGGTYTSDNYSFYIYTSGGTINVNSGTFAGDVKTEMNNTQYPSAVGTINISGGTFDGVGENPIVFTAVTANDHISISGGVFDAPIENQYCAEGYVPKDNGDGTYGVKPKDGVCLIKGNVGNNTFVIDEEASLLSGTPSKNNVRTNSSTHETLTGWKFNSRPAHLGLTLSEGTFQKGDVVEVFVTSVVDNSGSNDKMRVFTENDVTKMLVEGEADMVKGVNRLVLPETTTNALYLVRGAENADYDMWNPFVAYIAVYRAMKPVLTAISFNGEAATKGTGNAFAVTLPEAGTDLADMEIVQNIIRNAAHATTPQAVVSNEGAWVEGANTYRVMDKDGDYTDYTITITLIGAAETPVITADPAGAAYCAGNEPTLTVAANDPSDGGTLHYAWFKAGETDEAVGTDAASYTVEAAGTYYVIVTNKKEGKLDASATSANAVVTLNAPVSITTQPTDLKKQTEGANITLSVVAANATAYQWYSCDNKDKENPVLIAGADEAEYEFAAAAGFFYCEVTGLCGAIESNVAEVTVKRSAGCQYINATSGSQANLADGTIMYACGSDGKLSTESSFATASSNAKAIDADAVGSINKQYCVVKFPVDVEEITLYGYNSSNREVNNLCYGTAVGTDVKVNTAFTAYTKSKANDGNDRSMTIEFDEPFAKEKYLFIKYNSALEIYRICYTAALVEPKLPTLADQELCASAAYETFDATITNAAACEGTVSYKWYETTDPENPVATTAEFTPSAEGTYYVVVTHSAAGHITRTVQSDELSVAHFDALSLVSYTEDVYQHKGTEATLSVVATGKNVAYVWYTCSNAAGDDAVAITPAQTEASLTIASVAEGVQYYKVVISHDCDATTLSHVFKVEGWDQLEQVDVTATTTWDMTNVSASAIELSGSDKDARLLLANIDGVNNNASFNSQALYFEGQHIGRTGAGIKHLAGRYVQFNVTVPGAVFVTFESNGDNARTIRINDKKCARTTSGTAADKYITYALAVEPGSVEIMGMEGDAENKYVRISKIEFKAEASHTRSNVNPSYLGTLCWKNNAVLGGATLYEFAGKNEYNYLVFDEVAENRLEAGKPYIFMPENGNTEIKVYNTDNEDALTEDQDPVNNMYGTITGKTLVPGVDDNMYYFSSNHIWAVKDFVVNINIPAYYCYVDYAAVLASQPAGPAAPGRRRVTMGVQGSQIATGMGEIEASETPMKVMIDGQLFIIRGEKVFDATGRLVK